MNVLMLGDIFGRPGRKIVAEHLPGLIETYQPGLVVANGENAAGGFGLTKKVADELFDLGIHVLTSGNHIWDQKKCIHILMKIHVFLDQRTILLGYQGSSIFIHRRCDTVVAVLNLIGRVFMGDYDCPFRNADIILRATRGCTACHCRLSWRSDVRENCLGLLPRWKN